MVKKESRMQSFLLKCLTVLPLISTTCKVLVCPDRKSQGSLANPGINGRAALPPEPQICYVCNKIEKFWDTIAIHAYYSCCPTGAANYKPFRAFVRLFKGIGF